MREPDIDNCSVLADVVIRFTKQAVEIPLLQRENKLMVINLFLALFKQFRLVGVFFAFALVWF